MKNVFMVMLGGGLGSVCRYGVSQLSLRLLSGRYPFGTLAVNIVGSFVIGFLFTCAERRLVPDALRLLLITGFLGGFTTFSAFTLESIKLFSNGQPLLSVLHILIHIVCGLAAVCLGILVAGRV